MTRTPCFECGSYACRVQSPRFCRATGAVHVGVPDSGPGTVRLRKVVDKLAPAAAPGAGDGGAPAPDADALASGPRRATPKPGRQSTPARRKRN